MKNMSQHTEWLSMIEVSGPFLAVSVLEKIFPQGLESLETFRKKRIRSAYEEWRDAVEEDDPQLPELHRAWIGLVLEELLEYEDSVLEAASDGFAYKSPDGDGQLKPDFVLKDDGGSAPMLFVSIMPEGTDLEKVKVGDGWPVPVFERMTLLCRDKGVRLGLVTNGERWMLVNAPVGSTSSHVSWYARLWFQEPVTLKAFQSLLGVRRWFGPEEETLPVMLEESLQHHEEVTDTLGEQVKRAVEVLVQCLDKADQDRNRELLHDVPPAELYEAGLTVMMRLVFVLCAEERGLMLLGDQVYDQFYAIVTLRDQLDEERVQHGDEILERRHDAWTRLLAVFRAVYGGIEHESLRMPALGGSLFDPDRFPFLEGRAKGTHWQETPAQPLPIDNRTVLLLLEALQVLEQRGGALLLSYKALDVEQIGHVYEGLLEHTVRRLKKDTLGLIGSQKAKNPNIALAELESARLDGEEALVSIVEATTSRSKSAISNALAKEVDDAIFGRIITVCGGDMELATRLKPFAHLLRSNAWGDFIAYRAHSFAVTLGADRRETGTHYTPKSLTESIVETTLEPVAYVGPAEGKPREEWLLKSSTELLELKICDPAMGSGAFLVQVCRWLSKRLVEAWGKEAGQGKSITVDGVALESAGSEEPMPDSLDERLLIARRLVAEKCLYGLDLNPLAVELAKLSIWLITLAKGRPFGFLDHNLRSGDSLLGIHTIKQLTEFSLDPEQKRNSFLFASNIEAAVKDALDLRKQLRETPIRDIQDVQHMECLDQKARRKLEKIEYIADAMISEALAAGNNTRALNIGMENLSTLATEYIEGDNERGRRIIAEARKLLSRDLPTGKLPRKPFHWVLAFPEVFERGGFDGIVGNPPFVGGQIISGAYGRCYLDFLVNNLCMEAESSVDLAVFFFLRSYVLLNDRGCAGLIARRSLAEGKNKEAGLRQIVNAGGYIFSADTNFPWPGNASVAIHNVSFCKKTMCLTPVLNGRPVDVIAENLTDTPVGEPYQLVHNSQLAYQGTILGKNGFKVEDAEVIRLLQLNRDYLKVLSPFIGGKEVNKDPFYNPSCTVINFWDWRIDQAEKFPEVLEILEKNTLQDKGNLPKNWWRHLRPRPEMYEKIRDTLFTKKNINNKQGKKSFLERVIVIATGASKYPSFTFLPPNYIYSHKLCVIVDDRYSLFGVLSSDIHSSWAWLQKTSMGGDLYSLVYAHGNIFYTFPFPESVKNRENCDQLNKLGKKFFFDRQALMESTAIGLTAFYNKFHDHTCQDAEVVSLRELQRELNNCTLSEYGWDDIDLSLGFHSVDYLPVENNIRFTLSEEARHKVLQRLLKLNHERYEEEVAQGLHDKKKKKTSTPRKKKTSPAKDDGSTDLFAFMNALKKGTK